MENVFLFHSDQHLRERGSFPPFNTLDSNGLTRELNNMIAGFRFVADMIREYQPVMVGSLGDLYQNTEFQSARVLHGTHMALTPVADACKEVKAKNYCIPGNHDILNEHSMITSVNTLRSYFDKIFMKPSYVDVGGLSVCFLPASSNTGQVYSWLHEAQGIADLICTHQDFAGCRYESGAPSLSSLISNWDKPIISGDIHLPQKVGSVNYVGSLVQHKFYKYMMDNVGGVLLYYPSSGKVRRIPNSYSKHYIKVREVEEGLKLDPKKCILQVVSEKPKEEINEIFKDYEHLYIKAIPQGLDVEMDYSKFSLDDPGQLLRGHVNKEKPEAINMYDTVMNAKEK